MENFSLYVTYHVLHALGFIVNAGHILIISRMTFKKRDGGKHYQTFLLAVAIPDMLIAGLRLSFQSYAAQDILRNYKIICAISALSHQIPVMTQFSVLLLGILDRLAALTRHHYSSLFHVRHFKGIVVGMFITFTLGYAVSSGLVYEKAFSLGGMGVCKSSSPELPMFEPGLYPGLPMLLASIVLSFVIIHKTRRLQCSSNQQRARAKRLTLVIVLLLGLKFMCWMPVAVTLIVRVIGKLPLEEVMKILFCINVILDPFAYGLFMEKYRNVLVKLCTRKKSNIRRISSGQCLPSAFASSQLEMTNISIIPDNHLPSGSQHTK